VTQVLGQQAGDSLRNGHGLIFEGFAHSLAAAVDGGADADPGRPALITHAHTILLLFASD